MMENLMANCPICGMRCYIADGHHNKYHGVGK